ncbi:MAG: FKBP-type peptidyl-prolyl cis-trans isomerase [Candidatus Cryptobacteroides sp.]
MDRKIIFAAALATLISGGCAKEIDAGIYDDETRYLKAWLKQDHSDIGITIDLRNAETGIPDTLGRGVFLLAETEGSGTVAASGNYVRVKYLERQMSGGINSYSTEYVAKQLGTYDRTYYYGNIGEDGKKDGAQTFCLTAGLCTAGFADAVKGMKEGGTRTVLVPQWLNTTSDYVTENEYLNASNSDASSVVYDLTLLKVIEDFDQYRIDEIETFLKDKVYDKMFYDDGTPVTSVDSIGIGFYFIPITDTSGHVTFPSDTTIKINYTGYRLDGQAFDTTVEKTAKDNYIWSESTTYESKSVTWGESAGEITMDGSSLISGFTKTLWQMNKGRGIGIFWSTLGYGSSSSGNRIPAYAPLMFDVEFVIEEE